MKLTYIIKSSRLQTLPLGLSGVIYTSKVAYFKEIFSLKIFILYMITAILLQILSNFANDLGDAIKGTDKFRSNNAPKRMVESGNISYKQMKNIIIITSILCFLSGTYLSYISFPNNFYTILFFSVLGILAIVSALKYTIGKKAYGYMGMGDLFVFIFFGFVSILGGYYLYSKILDLENIFPAITFGLFSTGVLNINNLRDYKTDKESNKKTLVVKMGYKNGIIYHFILIILGFISLSFTNIFLLEKKYSLFMIGILLIFHLKKIVINKDINRELKYLSLITLCSAII